MTYSSKNNHSHKSQAEVTVIGEKYKVCLPDMAKYMFECLDIGDSVVAYVYHTIHV